MRQGHAILERPTYTQCQGLRIDSFGVKIDFIAAQLVFKNVLDAITDTYIARVYKILEWTKNHSKILYTLTFD